MVAAAGGNVERDVIFRLKAEVDPKSFQTLSRFGKEATKTQAAIDKGIERSAKKRVTIDEKTAQTAQRIREKAFAAEQKLLARGAKLIQKALDDRQKATEKAAKAELKARQQALKQLEKRRSEFIKNRERGLKAEQKAIKEATIQSEIFQKRGEAATKKFTVEIKRAAAGALLFARGLAFVGLASKEDLGKVVKAVIQVQGAFDILSGGERVIRSIIAAQKALTIATNAGTVAQVAQNAAQAAGTGATVAGGVARAGVLGRVAGAAGAAVAAAPVAAIAVGAAAVIGGFALFNKDFRQGLGEFLGILENANEQAKKALKKRIQLNQQESQERINLFQVLRRGREQQAQFFGRRQAVAGQFGAVPTRQAAETTLGKAEERTAAVRAELEKTGLQAVLEREQVVKRGLERAKKGREDAIKQENKIVKARVQTAKEGRKLRELQANIQGLTERIAQDERTLAKATDDTKNKLAETQEIRDELVTATDAQLRAQIQVGEAIKRGGEEAVRALDKRVEKQKQVVDLAKSALETAKQESKQLEDQRKTQEQQFGLLTRREQKRLAVLAQKLAAGEKLTKRQLIDVRQVATGRLQAPFEAQVAEQGRAQREIIERAQGAREGIQAAQLGVAAEARQVRVAEAQLAATEELLDAQIEKNKAELITLFNNKIDPIFTSLGEAIAISIETSVAKLEAAIRAREAGEAAEL